jgi:hypothetical protein
MRQFKSRLVILELSLASPGKSNESLRPGFLALAKFVKE